MHQTPAETLAAPRQSPGRLSIAYLLCLTAGVGLAIAAARLIELLRFPADSHFYGTTSVGQLDAATTLTAALYGVCVTTFLFALWQGPIWASPGKVLAMLFAVMCLLDWSLQALAAAVVQFRLAREPVLPPGGAYQLGFVGGLWYRQFSPAVGYLVALPLMLTMIWKTRAQPLTWRMVWIGFLAYALLILADIYLGVGGLLPDVARRWYFEAAIGVPVGLTAVALLSALAEGRRVDWWTAFVAGPLVLGWVALVLLKLFVPAA